MRFCNGGLDRATVVVHGRNSQEQQARSGDRRRLVVHTIAATAEHPSIPNARFWNPAGASFAEACQAIGVTDGMAAVTGGAEVFNLFLGIGFDAFHLSRAGKVRLPGGRPLEQILAKRGLTPGPMQVLDPEAEATLATWKPQH